ncbi:MAG: hypothetical protein JWN61_3092 [Pseudonocardiales bacterium]|nr:hypothetical protein [Pseudonocardiales bacterium]
MPHVTETITSHRAGPPMRLEVDMSGVAFMNSIALGTLIAVRNACIAVLSQLVAVDCSQPVRRLVAITAAGHLFGAAS